MFSGRSGERTFEELERLVLTVRVKELVLAVQRKHHFLDQLEVLRGHGLFLQLEVRVYLVRRVFEALHCAFFELFELEVQEKERKGVELAQENVFHFEVEALEVLLDGRGLAPQIFVGLPQANCVDHARTVNASWSVYAKTPTRAPFRAAPTRRARRSRPRGPWVPTCALVACETRCPR